MGVYFVRVDLVGLIRIGGFEVYGLGETKIWGSTFVVFIHLYTLICKTFITDKKMSLVRLCHPLCPQLSISSTRPYTAVTEKLLIYCLNHTQTTDLNQAAGPRSEFLLDKSVL